MWARYVGAFGTSVALHGALVVWLAWATIVLPPAGAGQPEIRMEVVLMPPTEDSAFPGLKPVERSAGGPPRDLRGEGQIAGADIDRIGGHMQVLFPFVRPGLA